MAGDFWRWREWWKGGEFGSTSSGGKGKANREEQEDAAEAESAALGWRWAESDGSAPFVNGIIWRIVSSHTQLKWER